MTGTRTPRSVSPVLLAVAVAVALPFLWNGAGETCADEVRVGQGSLQTVRPPGAKGPSDTRGSDAVPCVTKRVTGPVPTNDWWSSLVWKRRPENRYSENLYAHPLAFRARADGLGVGYPTQAAVAPDGRNYHFHYARDLTVGVEGLEAPDARVDGYTDWTVTALWEGGGRTLRATIGHGLPYVYCEAAGGDAVVAFQGKPTIWHRDAGAVGVTINGHHYGIFAPGGAPWEGERTLRSSLVGKGYFSVAVLPERSAAVLDLLRRHAFAFVTDTRVSWRYDQPRAMLVTEFAVTTQPREGTERRPLLALYRHQWLHTSAELTPHAYVSPRGAMKVLIGNEFATRMPLTGVLPALPDAGGCDRDRLRGYVDAALSAARPIGSKDVYWTGKELGRLASLAAVADQVGHTEARDRFLSLIRGTLQDWFRAPDGKTARLFHHDRRWGTLIAYPAGYGSDTELNDHHFHYGYFLMAAATVARFDRRWATDANWGGMVRLLIKDAANADRRDGRFPYLRCFDPYAGHSWANGPAAFAAGNNQESSSEALNFAAALILWGAATGDAAARDLGIFLYANEVRAVEQYWFDADRAVFPDGFRHSALGILWGNGGAYATWWTGNPEEIHGINFLPMTGGSLYLGRRPDYVARNYRDLVATNGGPEAEWRDIIWMFRAMADPQGALAAFERHADYRPTSGLSKAHTYHWLGNLAAMGRLDATVTASIPTAAVFAKGRTRIYAAWNPRRRAVTVSFSDGAKVEVPAGALLCKHGTRASTP